MNLQTSIRDRARGLRGPGLTSEQETQVVEAIALGAAIPNITATSGEKLNETSALSAVNGGATLISVGGRAVGWTIPAGQTGAGTNVIARIPFSYDETARLAGSTIRIRVVATVTAGYLAATPFDGVAVRVDRKDGTIDNNAGSVLPATQSGTRLVRDFLYTMVGNERFVGGTMRLDTNSATAATRSLQITSVTWDVVATPATAGATGADAALEARVTALRPAANMIDKVEPDFQLRNGAQALFDASGRTVGVVIPKDSRGQNTIMQWRLPMQGRLRKMLPGRQIKLTLGFNTPANWSRAHVLTMQARNIDLTLDNSIVAPVAVDEQISPTRRAISFTCLIPTGAVLDDLRPYIVLTDAAVAVADETIELTDFTVDYAQNNSDVMQEAASTTLLGDEFTRSASVDQAVGTIDGTGKRIGALLRSTSFASIAAALQSATNLAAPGAAAAVTVPAGIHVATSLGVIGSGTDGDNVILRGEGMGRTIIDGRLPANTPVATIQATSPVDFNASQEVSDLTIWGKNCRYGWHIDAVKFKPNSRLIARNVEVIHYGNDEANAYWGSTTWASPHGIAIGTCSGSVYRFENVKATGPRAGLSAHDQIDFTSPSHIEIINSDLTATWAANWALRLESIGAPMMNQCVMQGTKLSGEISMAVTPWLPTALDQQPADHRTWDLSGSGNSPAVFRIEDFGRALRITSSTDGTASKVVVSGTAAPVLFGKTGTAGVTRVDGDIGFAGHAYGWADIADVGSKAAITKLGARLGNRTGSPLTLTVQVDALAPVNITLDQNYTSMTNAAILGIINSALGSTATASEYAVGQRYRPFFADEEKSFQNTSGTTILMGMALAVDSNGIRTVRPMLSTDLPTAFAGIAWEDIRPNAYGRVKTGGWLPTTDLLRSDGGSPNPGTTFTIDPAKPGYVLSNNASGSGILPVIRGSLGAGLWTVAVRTQIDGQDVVDQAASLVQEAYDVVGALGDSDNIGAIGRIPTEGADVIPVYGDGVAFDPNNYVPTGVQAILPVVYKSRNPNVRTRAQMEQFLNTTPELVQDDAPYLKEAIRQAIKAGYTLLINTPLYSNSPVTAFDADGIALHILGQGEGSIYGGPNRTGPMIQVSNIFAAGSTQPSTIDALIEGLYFDNSRTPGGILSSADAVNLNGFRSTHMHKCVVYAADSYHNTSNGDAGFGLRGNRLLVTYCDFYGTQDGGVYLTANPSGLIDNASATLIGNRYFGCRSGWSAKREFQYIRSIGEIFDYCLGNFGTGPGSTNIGTPTGFINPAKKLIVSGAQVRNPIGPAVDLRMADDSIVDVAVSGIIGRYPDGTEYTNSHDIIRLLGTSRTRIRAIIRNEDPSPLTSLNAVRMERTTDQRTNSDVGSYDNVVEGTVSNVANGFVEGTLCDRNSVRLKLDNVTTPASMTGALSVLTYDSGGLPTTLVRGIDRTPGRLPFAGALTAGSTLSTDRVGKISPFNITGNVNCLLPSSAKDGEEIGVMLGDTSAGFTVLIRDNANTTTISSVTQPGGMVVLVWRSAASAWVEKYRSVNRGYLSMTAVTAASVPVPALGVFHLFVDSADNLLKVKNSANTVTAV